MGSRPVMLQDDAYARLKAARRPGESFTEAVNRLVAGQEPSLLDFVGLIPRKDADELARVVEEMRAQDIALEQKRWGPVKGGARRRDRGRHL